MKEEIRDEHPVSFILKGNRGNEIISALVALTLNLDLINARSRDLLVSRDLWRKKIYDPTCIKFTEIKSRNRALDEDNRGWRTGSII